MQFPASKHKNPPLPEPGAYHTACTGCLAGFHRKPDTAPLHGGILFFRIFLYFLYYPFLPTAMVTTIISTSATGSAITVGAPATARMPAIR